MAIATTQHDIVSLLTADHREVRDLLNLLQDAKGAQAKRLFLQIQRKLEVHTTVEEEIVYPAYKKCVGDKDAKVMVQESLTEHGLVDRLLEQMSSLQPSSVEFQGKATVLKEMVEHHAKDEEKEMFPTFRKECSEQKLHDLAQRVEKRKKALENTPVGAGSSSRRSGSPAATRGSGSATGSSRRSGSDGKTKQELYQLAKKAGVEGRSQMDKDELRKALGRR